MNREILLQVFNVDLNAGRFFWKLPPTNHSELMGMEAGCPRRNRSKSYWVIKVGKVAYKRGRLIFLVAHGKFPSPCVDHINGESLDDRLSNLREATFAENARNVKCYRSGSLPMGVKAVASGKFQARIRVSGRPLHLGTFSTAALAASAYQKARREYFGAFA